MKQIVIPMFNLVLNINPIAFHIFGVPVYWYAIFIVGSIILALYLMKRRSNPTPCKMERVYIWNSL